MKLFLTVLLCAAIIGTSYSATIMANPQCAVCKSTLDWVRANQNVLIELKNDEQVSQEFLDVLDSDISSESACGLIAMCEASVEETDYLVNFKGSHQHGGHHQTHYHAHVHVGHDCQGDNC